MKIIPAIDIKGGRCVRLFQGRMDRETVYSHNPLEVARRWEDMGAEMVHVVDLDGAVAGMPVNSKVIEDIISSLNIYVQVGGGIRDIETVKHYFDMGAYRVVLGTALIENMEFVQTVSVTYQGHIVVSLDAKDGMIAVKGWTEVKGIDAIDKAKMLEESGISALIFTDINRDGTMTGPDIKSIERLLSAVKIPVIASGGVSGMEDIKVLLGIKNPGLEGVIVGKALYSGTVDLTEAIDLTRQDRCE